MIEQEFGEWYPVGSRFSHVDWIFVHEKRIQPQF